MGWLTLVYVAILWGISWWAGRRQAGGLDTYYTGRRKAHWLWVSYGMVGTALSGFTFLSLPGSIRADGWTYLQVVTGYFLGYVGVAFGLLPLYYKYSRASVYEYFRHRLGRSAEKTATVFFLISRSLGSSLRLFLALWVLQRFFPGWPFWALSAAALGVILLYSGRSGIGAIIYTDFFQTTVFLGAAAAVFFSLWGKVSSTPWALPLLIDSRIESPHFWLKDVIGGALIAFSMTGLDQDQMQKNLSLPTLREAQKNLLLYGGFLFPVNGLFLWLGTLLWGYAEQYGLVIASSDELFVQVVEGLRQPGLAIVFVLGLSAAALSSADGTLTALTTVTLRNLLPPRWETTRMKTFVLLIWTLLFWLMLWGYTWLPREGHLLGVFLRLSGYVYGPLLGLFLYSCWVRRPSSAHRHITWLLPLGTGVAVGLEKLLPFSLGYGTILWTAGVCLLVLSIAIRVFLSERHGAVSKPEHTKRNAPDSPQ